MSGTATALQTAFVLAALAIGAPAAMGQPRTWTDAAGKFSVEAELVEVKQADVVLKKANGSTVTVPLARLSDADRAFLKTVPRAAVQPPVGGGQPAKLVFPDATTEPPAWNDASTPFDMAAFLKAPPAEENAAPLYFEALYEFAPQEMIDLLYPDLPQEELKRRYDSFRPRSKELTRLEEAWEKDPQSVDGAAVDALLVNFDAGFEKLAAAQQRPTCMFQPGRSFHSLWPHIQAARNVYRVVAWRSRRDIERGDLERPLQDLKTLLRLRRDLQVRGGFIAQVVAFAFDGRCYELVRTLLNAPGVNASHCDRLLALLADHEEKSIDAFVEANRAEYIGCRQAVYDFQHRTGSFDPRTMNEVWGFEGDATSPLACCKLLSDMSGSPPEELAKLTARLQDKLQPSAWQGGKMLSDEDYAQEVHALNRYFATILVLAEQPNFERQAEADVEAAEAPILETTLASFVIPPQGGLLQAMLRSKAQLRGAQCLVALRRWQLEHQEAPPDLAMLVKAAGMLSAPRDPYADQPLRLGAVAGKPVIYSVGPDGKDDQAQVEWNLVRGKPGDFIFRLETPLK